MAKKRKLELERGRYQGDIPLFYLKIVGNSPSVYLGTSHDYLFSKNTLEEVADELGKLFDIREKSEKSFWETIIYKYTVMPPKLMQRKRYSSYNSDKKEDENSSEKWFRGAWYIGTFNFFDEYPEYETYDTPPADIIKEILYGPVKQKKPIKKGLTKSSKVKESVKADEKPRKKRKPISIKEKIKKKKSKSQQRDVSSNEGKSTKKKKDVLSRLKKKKKASKL